MIEQKVELLSGDRLRELLSAHARYIASQGADGKRADLSLYVIEGFDFSGLDLSGIRADNSILRSCRFIGADLSRASFVHSQAAGTDFGRANLTKAEFHGSDLGEARFDGARLVRASFVESSLAEATFRMADLTAAVIARCDLRGASFDGATLAHVDLRDNQNDERGRLTTSESLEPRVVR